MKISSLQKPCNVYCTFALTQNANVREKGVGLYRDLMLEADNIRVQLSKTEVQALAEKARKLGWI